VPSLRRAAERGQVEASKCVGLNSQEQGVLRDLPRRAATNS
jgi:hypothetical protein